MKITFLFFTRLCDHGLIKGVKHCFYDDSHVIDCCHVNITFKTLLACGGGIGFYFIKNM